MKTKIYLKFWSQTTQMYKEIKEVELKRKYRLKPTTFGSQTTQKYKKINIYFLDLQDQTKKYPKFVSNLNRGFVKFKEMGTKLVKILC